MVMDCPREPCAVAAGCLLTPPSGDRGPAAGPSPLQAAGVFHAAKPEPLIVSGEGSAELLVSIIRGP